MVGKISAASGALQSLAKCHSLFFIMALICRIGEGRDTISVVIKSMSSSGTGVSTERESPHFLYVLMRVVNRELIKSQIQLFAKKETRSTRHDICDKQHLIKRS